LHIARWIFDDVIDHSYAGEDARMLRGRKHSGFDLHRSRRVLADKRKDLEPLVQYIIRNPFSVEKMQLHRPHGASPQGSSIYRCGITPKIQRNFKAFTPSDFIAAVPEQRSVRGGTGLSPLDSEKANVPPSGRFGARPGPTGGTSISLL